jgi:hypothetical protein
MASVRGHLEYAPDTSSHFKPSSGAAVRHNGYADIDVYPLLRKAVDGCCSSGSLNNLDVVCKFRNSWTTYNYTAYKIRKVMVGMDGDVRREVDVERRPATKLYAIAVRRTEASKQAYRLLRMLQSDGHAQRIEHWYGEHKVWRSDGHAHWYSEHKVLP